jgi:type II secretory pathway component GspD/PulD (secretin)
MRFNIVLIIGVFIAVLSADAIAQQTPNSPTGSRPGLRGDRSTETDRNRNNRTEPARPGVTTKRTGGGLADQTVVTGGAIEPAPARAVVRETEFEPHKRRNLDYGALPNTGSEEPISMAGPIAAAEFLDTISIATGWNIVASAEVQKIMLQFWVNEMTPQQAMAILKFNDVFYWFDEQANILFVMTKAEYLEKEFGDVVKHEFKIANTSLANIETALMSLSSPKGRIILDPATSTVMVYEMQDNLDMMKEVVAKMDRTSEAKTYALTHVNGEDLFDSVEILLSEGGKVSYDPRTNVMLIVDRPKQHAEIKQLIDTIDKPLETKTWTLNYADPVLVAEELALSIPESMGIVTINEELHQVSVKAIAQRLEDAEQRIEILDQKTQQVQIEAFLVTVGKDVVRNLGVNWGYLTKIDGNFLGATFGNQDFVDTSTGIATVTPPPAASNTLSYTFGSNKVGVALDFLETEGDAKILAQPRITVRDGFPARFENVTRVPYQGATVNITNVNNDRTTTTVEFIDVGTILEVIPRIAQEGNILMDIIAEDSTFTLRKVAGEDVPEKTQNIATTQVLVRHEETLIIGGLRSSNLSDTSEKVPVLGDIPILGRAFRSTGRNHRNTELLIFLTPTIVDETTQPESIMLAEFDEAVARKMKIDEKSDFKRGLDSLGDHRDLMIVSIGQRGSIMLDGNMSSMVEVDTSIKSSDRVATTLVIRSHPRSPNLLSEQIETLGHDAGMKVDYDKNFSPFVPISAQE